MSTQRAVSIALSALVTGPAVLAIGLWMNGARFDRRTPSSATAR
jgi:hypothetical protein